MVIKVIVFIILSTFLMLIFITYVVITYFLLRHRTKKRIKAELQKFNYELVEIEQIGITKIKGSALDKYDPDPRKHLTYRYDYLVNYTNGKTKESCKAKITQFLFWIRSAELEFNVAA